MLISIIIPTYNRHEQLRTCLESLTKLNYDHQDFEVIVVDDGSQTSLDGLVNLFSPQLNLQLITQTNAGPATARNRGAKEAQGEFLAFIDDDCFVSSDWLRVLKEYLTNFPSALIGGKTINALPENLFSTASQMLIDYLYSVYNFNSQEAQFFTSNNMALSAQLFDKIGGFNLKFPLAAGEDREFCYRLYHQGYQMIYAEEVIIYHAHNLRLSSFWQQNFNYGKGAYYFKQFINNQNQDFQEIKVSKNNFQPLSFYGKLVFYPLKNKSKHNSLLLIFLFIISQLAVISGYWQQKYQNLRSIN